MTMAELIAAAEQRLASAIAERKTKNDALVAMRSLVEQGDQTITDQAVTDAIAARDASNAKLADAEAKLAGLRAELAEDERITKLQQEILPTGATRGGYDRQVRIGQEARTYTAEAERGGLHFLRDLVGGTFGGDFEARDRLARHMREERVERAHYFQRDVGTSAFAGLTVPQYLTELVAPKMRERRNLADNCRKLPLPADGMTVNLSRITTGTAVAHQSSQAGAVQETDIDDTLLTVDVKTIAGQQDVSWQALARSVGTESVILEDLIGAYHSKLDYSIINDDGTSGTHLGIRSTSSISTATLTDTTPTPSEAIGALYEIQSTIETAMFQGATHLVMHPRRWHWFRSAIGTDQALISQGVAYGPSTLGTVNGNGYGPGVRGELAGLPVIVDANIPTTLTTARDVILAITADELFLWEDPSAPLFIRAEQPGAGNLMTKLVVYGFSAFTAGRYPAAQGVISGSGLEAPTVFGKAIS